MATYQKNEDITFVNPYTFVPLSEDGPKRIDAKMYYSENQEKLQSGYLQCHIEVKTPLAIPDVESKKSEKLPSKKNENNGLDNKHDSYSFFKFNINGKDNYAIPGSSIRGAVRSVYETMTDSCMCTAQAKTRISLRVDPEDYFNAGLLIRNDKQQWELFKAKSYSVQYRKTQKDENNKDDPIIFSRDIDENTHEAKIEGFYYGDEVSFSKKGGKVTGIGKKGELTDPGILFIGETFSEKHSEHIFVQKDQIKREQEEINAAFEGLKQTVLDYRNKAINKDYDGETHLGYPGFERACQNGVLPIWYKIHEGHLYLTLASLGRKQFIKSYNELLNNHIPCTDRASVCPACLIFGMIGDNHIDHHSLGSRIRFTDAQFSNENPTDYLLPGPYTYILLKELSAPKPSYLPFYSKNGASYDSKDGGIRGRKYYWHNPKAENTSDSYEDVEKTKRNSSIQLMKPGAGFDFRIYFDQITQEQLDGLMAAVTLGKDSKYCHKLGHGKPLGLGSVKIKISQIVKRKYQNGSYQIEAEDDPEISIALSEELKAVLSYPADLDNSIPISYPRIEISKACQDKLSNPEIMNNGFEPTNEELKPKELNENVQAAHQWFKAFKDDGGLLPELFSMDPNSEEAHLAKQDLPIYELINYDDSDIKK